MSCSTDPSQVFPMQFCLRGTSICSTDALGLKEHTAQKKEDSRVKIPRSPGNAETFREQDTRASAQCHGCRGHRHARRAPCAAQGARGPCPDPSLSAGSPPPHLTSGESPHLKFQRQE